MGNSQPSRRLLSRLGLYFQESFLAPDLCDEILVQARQAGERQATVTLQGVELLDQGTRQTKRLQVPATLSAALQERLLALRPELEAHFRTTLTGVEVPQLLLYRAGDFFKPHIDSIKESEGAQHAPRKISSVIFLNDSVESNDAGEYSGGTLTFYRLLEDDPMWKNYGFPLIGSKGLLVAFPSDIFHEVTPVQAGERYTATAWFF